LNKKTNAQRNWNECSAARVEYENADTLQHIATHCNTQAVFVLKVRMLLRNLPELKVHCVAACCSVLQRVAICCCLCTQHENAAAQFTRTQGALCCSMLQRVAACCSVLQRVAMCCCLCTQHENAAAHSICALQHAATHCNTLQHNATYCNTLQHTTTHCNTLQHTAPHCTTLHHTAPLFNTLQHTATYCDAATLKRQHTAA